MKSSVIRQRVADFFRRHPPFDQFREEDLLELAGSGRVKFHESGEYLFQAGGEPGEFLWLIQQGRVEVLQQDGDGKESLRDILSEGDLLGLDRFAGDGAFRHAARTASDVILYSCSAALFESFSLRYPAVKRFLAAQASISSAGGFDTTSWLDAEAPPLDFLRARQRETTAAGAGTPAIAAGSLTTREAVRAMLRSRSRQLRITTDGAGDAALEAILTESDLGLFCGHQPVLLIESIRAATSVAELKPLIGLASRMVMSATAQPRDVDDGCRLGSAATTAATEACIRMATRNVAAVGPAPVEGVPHCWILFGASAREETLRLEAPAIAVACDDSSGRLPKEAALYFTALAGQAAEFLHHCGLAGAASCWPDGTQPAMPLSEWKRFYSETISDPICNHLYTRREFFDLAPLSGDPRILARLCLHIGEQLRSHPETVALLANDTLVHLPPVTLFQGLVLDLEGGRSDKLDLMQTMLAPVADSARVFALGAQRLDSANTLERLRAAQADSPAAAAAIGEAADAYRAGLYYRALADGAIVDPGRLSKFDQVMLKSAFGSIQRFVEHTVSSFFPAVI